MEEIKTCKDCIHGYMYIENYGNNFKYSCLKHEFKLSKKEYSTCICDSFIDKSEEKKIKFNFRKVKEMA